MTSSEIKQIAQVAEKACAAVVNHPRNADARMDLFNALAPVVDAAFVESAATSSARLRDLLPQAGVWANIVRCREEILRDGSTPPSAALIQYPARGLLQILAQLLAELEQREVEAERHDWAPPRLVARVKI